MWIVLAAMVLGATAAVLVPLLIQQQAPQSRAEHDLEIYRDQLAEVERDHARGLISDMQVDAARTEIGRRLLATEDVLAAADPVPRPASRAGLAAALAIILPFATFGLYGMHGSPGMPGMPAKDRPMASTAASAANAGSQDLPRMVEQLAERLRQNSDDPKGWQLLARSLSTLRQFPEAAEAFARAAALQPDDANIRSLYGEALMAANQGQVSAAARLAFTEAIARDAKEPRARFYLGLAALQSGDRADALARWQMLVSDSKPDDQWMPMLHQRIASLGGSAPPAPEAAPEPAPGPSSDDVAAAQQMSPGDRMSMIRGMVGRLAERLAEEPDNAQGWARLARSYRVLGETEMARDALAQVARLKPDDVEVLTAYAQSMIQAAKGGVPPTEFGAVISRILGLDPKNQTGLWIAGLVAEKMGDTADARRYWQRLKPLVPEGSSERADLERRIEALDKPK